MRDSRGKPKTKTVSWPGPMGHVSAIRKQCSEEQAVEYSLASTTTEIALSPCLDVSRQRTVQNCQPSLLRWKYTMGLSRSGQTVNVQCALRPAVHVVRRRSAMRATHICGTNLRQLRLGATRRLDFVWVKGHATKLNIDRQITTTLNKGGNDAADALASAAGAHHAAPQALTEAAIGRQRTAMVMHSFASELLFKRRVALLALHEADHC